MTNGTGFARPERLSVGGVEPDVLRRGAGRPVLLLLHGVQPVDPRAPFLDLLFTTHAESEKSIRLFSKEVLPRLREIKPVTVD